MHDGCDWLQSCFGQFLNDCVSLCTWFFLYVNNNGKYGASYLPCWLLLYRWSVIRHCKSMSVWYLFIRWLYLHISIIMSYGHSRFLSCNSIYNIDV